MVTWGMLREQLLRLITDLETHRARETALITDMGFIKQWKKFWEREFASWKTTIDEDMEKFKRDLGRRHETFRQEWLQALTQHKDFVINMLQQDFVPPVMDRLYIMIRDHSLMLREAQAPQGELVV